MAGSTTDPALSPFHGPGGAALVVALVAVLKQAFPGIRDRYTALLAVLLCVALNVGLAISDGEYILPHVLEGIAVMLLATGAYGTAKTLLGRPTPSTNATDVASASPRPRYDSQPPPPS
jgi:hypothetical protein